MATWHKNAALIALLLAANTTYAGELYARAGWVADIPLGAHQVRGRATIIDDTTIHLEQFYYDGGGPAVYFYLGETDGSAAFASGLELMPLLTGQPFFGYSITLTLPPGETLDSYGAISVWCAAVGVSFSSASFLPPTSPPYPRAGWVAEITNGFHQVEAIATIIDERIIYVEHFTYDGTAPLVYFYLGSSNTQVAFVSGLELPPLLDRAYADESLVLTLPGGETLDAYTAISAWCAQFEANFGSAVFKLDEPADADNDGDVDLEDHAAFVDCMDGPNMDPAPAGLTIGECLDAFDYDADGDVDVADYGRFEIVFTGSGG